MKKKRRNNILASGTIIFPRNDFGRHATSELRAVLVEGTVGDYAVYLGDGSDDWVSRFGNKASFRMAKAFFPYLEKDKYRE